MEENKNYLNKETIEAIKAARMLEPWKNEFKMDWIHISCMIHHEDSDYIGLFDIELN